MLLIAQPPPLERRQMMALIDDILSKSRQALSATAKPEQAPQEALTPA